MNPNIVSIPALDEKDKIAELRLKIQENQGRKPEIQDITRRLIASSFYFENLSFSQAQSRMEKLGFTVSHCCEVVDIVIVWYQ